MAYKYSLPSVAYIFILFTWFTKQKFLILYEVQLIHFSLTDPVLGAKS